MRAWIEIAMEHNLISGLIVALFMRAWIEISAVYRKVNRHRVALFMRAWIEITGIISPIAIVGGRPLHEGVD